MEIRCILLEIRNAFLNITYKIFNEYSSKQHKLDIMSNEHAECFQ